MNSVAYSTVDTAWWMFC